jgi:hypothetical protein
MPKSARLASAGDEYFTPGDTAHGQQHPEHVAQRAALAMESLVNQPPSLARARAERLLPGA